MRSDTAPDRLRSLPSWLMAQAIARAQRIVGEQLGSAGARRPHYTVLAALEQFGPHSQADLGRRCGIDRSDMVAVLDELGAGDLVRRRPDPTDARRNRVSITAAGRRHLRRLDRLVAAAQDDLVAPLTAHERVELTRLLTKLVDAEPADEPEG